MLFIHRVNTRDEPGFEEQLNRLYLVTEKRSMVELAIIWASGRLRFPMRGLFFVFYSGFVKYTMRW